jgi:hypothetical protein
MEAWAESIDVTLLAKLCQVNLTETRVIRCELADLQRLAIKTVEVLTKMERRNEARNAAINGRFSVVDAP